MFTGIVEETGRVASFTRGAAAWRLVVEARTVLGSTAVGDSIAVNGCCLTAVEIGEGRVQFDLLEETCRLTNLSTLTSDARVNLERSLRPDSRMGGHFVSGHIDGVGTVDTLEPRGADRYLRVRYPAAFRGLLVPKGCIAVDGISLTVVEVHDDWFSIWLIPHTLEATNLGSRQAGDAVNLEFDLLAKYVDRLLSVRGASAASASSAAAAAPVAQGVRAA